MPDVDALRQPLRTDDLIVPGDTCWSSVEVLATTPSSNAELVARCRAGAAHGAVLVAEEQTAGRGRRDRGWTAPARSSVMVSALFRPGADPGTWGWLPLLTAVAVADAVRLSGIAHPEVKWPNDVLVAGRKVAGVLCEVVPGDAAPGAASPEPAVVAGWGLNVSQLASELPGPAATSLLLEGADTDRGRILRRALDRWEHWYSRWEHGDVGGVREAYEAHSSTIGARVRATLPGGRHLEGDAIGLADGGGLVLLVAGEEVVVAAADVVHLRPVLPR